MGQFNDVEQYRKRFQTILEYTQVSGTLNEAEPEEPMAGNAPMGGEDPMAGGAPMGGEQPAGGESMGGEDPMAGGAPMGGEDPMAGGEPMGGEQPEGEGSTGVEGLNPQRGEETAPEPEEGDDMPDDVEDMQEDDEVIDVDELTAYQQKTAKGVGKISDELKDLKKLITMFQDKVDANGKGIEDLRRELERRAPNAEEKITLRQSKSGPFTQTIEGYWENNAPENYSTSPDDEVDNPKYVITKSDVDGITDWNNISKTFDELSSLNDLRNIFEL